MLKDYNISLISLCSAYSSTERDSLRAYINLFHLNILCGHTELYKRDIAEWINIWNNIKPLSGVEQKYVL